MQRVLIVATLLTAVALLAPPIRTQARLTGAVLRQSYDSLTTTTFEQRRRAFYGDCDNWGYGYVARMVSGFPDARGVPRLRNPKWDPMPTIVPMVLPGFRRNLEDRVLIATGLAEADARESRMAHAERRSTDHHGTEAWRFTTMEEFDLMTGVALAFSTHPARQATTMVKLTLLHSAEHPAVLGEWEFQAPPEGTSEVVFRLPRPLLRFSLGRALMPFMLKVQTQGDRALTAIDVLGVKVNMGDYVVVNREGECFAAVKRDLLADLERTHNRSWSQYLAAIRNVRND